MKMCRTLFTPAALVLAAALAGGAPARAADVLVPIRGVVSGQPENVAFAGAVRVNSRLAPDPDFGRPQLVLTIDLAGVSGVGSSTSSRYVIEGAEVVQRRLAASHSVEITFPFMKSRSTDSSSARSGVASFVLDFDVNTGAVTNATGNISTPSF